MRRTLATVAAAITATAGLALLGGTATAAPAEPRWAPSSEFAYDEDDVNDDNGDDHDGGPGAAAFPHYGFHPYQVIADVHDEDDDHNWWDSDDH